MELQENEYPGLPKWPASFVTGKTVTPEQAKDIIFRTDSSLAYPSEYGFGNDQRFAKRCIKLFSWDKLIDLQNVCFKQNEAQKKLLPAGYERVHELFNAYLEEMGYIGTSYVGNNWLASAYIGGPHGWMSPSGNIHHDGHNWGKWPSVSEIVDDWKKLVAAFPYIEAVNTLYSGEACQDDSEPVCTIVIKGGQVKVLQPDLSLHDRVPEGSSDFTAHIFSIMTGDHSREHGWPAGWVEEYGAKSTAAIKKLAPSLFR